MHMAYQGAEIIVKRRAPEIFANQGIHLTTAASNRNRLRAAVSETKRAHWKASRCRYHLISPDFKAAKDKDPGNVRLVWEKVMKVCGTS